MIAFMAQAWHENGTLAIEKSRFTAMLSAYQKNPAFNWPCDDVSKQNDPSQKELVA
jgi:hypothetical protein